MSKKKAATAMIVLCPDWRNVCKNPLTSRLLHDGRGYRLLVRLGDNRVDTVSFRGITAALKTRYWPTYKPVKTPSAKRRLLHPPKCRMRRASGLVAARVIGQTRGRVIHRQLSDYARIMDFDTLGPYKSPDRLAEFERSCRDPHTKKPNVHPCTSQVLAKMCGQWRWLPLAGDFYVFNPHFQHRDNRWATGIDLIAVDVDSRTLVLIELKTGSNGNFEMGNATMRHNMGLSNSPLNQAKVQLVASSLLFTEMYQGDMKEAQLFVVWAPSDASTVRRFPVTSQEYQRIRDVLLVTWFHQAPYRSSKKKRVWSDQTATAVASSSSSQDDATDDDPTNPTGGNSGDDDDDDEYSDGDDDDDDDNSGDMGMNATRGFW